MKKWYVAYTGAEGVTSFVVELSDSELEVVKRFIDASSENIVHDNYGGTFWIEDNTSYDTKEEAIKHAYML